MKDTVFVYQLVIVRAGYSYLKASVPDQDAAVMPRHLMPAVEILFEKLCELIVTSVSGTSKTSSLLELAQMIPGWVHTHEPTIQPVDTCAFCIRRNRMEFPLIEVTSVVKTRGECMDVIKWSIKKFIAEVVKVWVDAGVVGEVDHIDLEYGVESDAVAHINMYLDSIVQILYSFPPSVRKEN